MTNSKASQKAGKKPVTKSKSSKVFTDEELAAMREHAKEQKAEARRGSLAEKAAEAEGDVLAKIASMHPSDRGSAEKLHAIVKTAVPSLSPKLWYGMPAYANEDGQVVCFFQDSQKFKTRYSTLGFSDKAHLDDGNMWPTSYALMELSAAEETKITTLLKKAVS